MTYPPSQPSGPDEHQPVAPYAQASDGYPRYGAHPQAEAPMGYYYPPPPRPLRRLGLVAAWLAGTLAVMGLFQAVLAWPAQSRYVEAAERGETFLEVWTPFDTVGLLQVPLTIAAYVVTCLWLYRARTNAAVMQPHLHHARSPGWVWGGWVCPVVNFWFPYQVVRDVARDPQAPQPVPNIGTWWTLWLVTTFTTAIGGQFAGVDTSVPVFATVVTIGAALNVATLVLWLRIVRDITDHQERRMAAAYRPLGT
jgi:hypothetical protein